MSEEKRRDSAGRLASAIALPEWSLRRKLALMLTIPMLLAATFGGLRVQGELSESDNYSATASHVTVLRPAADYLAAAERAVIVSRQKPALEDPDRLAAIEAVNQASERLSDVAASADLSDKQQTRLDQIQKLSIQLRDGGAYVSAGQAVSQVRQLQRGVTQLIDAIVNEQQSPEPKLAALQQALDGRVSLAMQQYQVNIGDPKQINDVDLAAELGVEQVIIDRLGSYLGTDDEFVLALNQQNAAHFGVIRNGQHDLGDVEAFEPYDALSNSLLNDIDANLTAAANDARALAIANAVITVALLVAAILLALLVSRLLLNPIRRVREGALDIANERLPEMVARIRAGQDAGEIVPIPVTTHEEMGQLARAVDDMNRQAVNLASGEARLRTQVGEMFSTLSRRNNSLINQQLSLIERLERDEKDSTRLESLFRLDHLASRMRRTADSLMVLADAPVAASDTDSLELGDVFQAAMAGVQEYQRVQIETAPTQKVHGAAAADVVHLMTELVDNALAFSPPTAPVKISSKPAGDSILVEISDGGLGIAPDVLVDLNADLRSGGDVTPDTARRMGLLVVSRLAKRHGLTVSLARNTRGGTTATVLVPPSLLRARPAQPAAAGSPQAKQRPGLASMGSAKAAPAPAAAPAPVPAPAPVAEQLVIEPPKKERPGKLGAVPAAPATPEAPAAPAPAARGLFSRSAAPAPAPAPAEPKPAARQPEAPVAKAAKPDVEVDSIAAAINAVTRLPQRSPGATRTGGVMPGAAPVSQTGGSLFQRLQAKKAEEADGTAEPVEAPEPAEAAAAAPAPAPAPAEAPESTERTERTERTESSGLPQREPATPTAAFDTIDETPAQPEVPEAPEAPAVREPELDLAPASAEALREDAEQRAGSSLGDVVTPMPSAPATPGAAALPRRGLSNFHSINGQRNGSSNGSSNGHSNGSSNGHSNGQSNGHSNGHSNGAGPAEPVAEPVVDPVAEAPEPAAPEAPAPSWIETAQAAPTPPPAVEPTYDLLDSRTPVADLGEDETPIYKNLRSRWLSSDEAGATWTTSEIEAGWEAAEQVAEAPPLRVSESGLPMRRPGNRLVPGGVSTAPTAPRAVRDPEAIRARLAAHAAGVSRGRTAAVDESVTTPSSTSEEGPA